MVVVVVVVVVVSSFLSELASPYLHTHTQHTQRRVKTMAVSDMQEMASVKIILPRAPVLDEHARD